MAAAVLVGGCSAEQRRSLGEEDARDALTMQIERVLDAEGIELDGDLDCQSTITGGSAVTANCSGVADSGADVSGSFDGSADVDGETCSARLVVSIDGRSVVDQPQVDCFKVA